MILDKIYTISVYEKVTFHWQGSSLCELFLNIDLSTNPWSTLIARKFDFVSVQDLQISTAVGIPI